MILTQAEADQEQKAFMEKLADKKCFQRIAADGYANLLAYHQHWMFDWGEINKAIIEKWSPRGLVRVKEAAWKLALAEKKRDKIAFERWCKGCNNERKRAWGHR